MRAAPVNGDANEAMQCRSVSPDIIVVVLGIGQRLCVAAVDVRTVTGQQVVTDRLPDEVVPEAVARFVGDEHSGIGCVSYSGRELGVGESGDRGEQPVAHPRPAQRC